MPRLTLIVTAAALVVSLGLLAGCAAGSSASASVAATSGAVPVAVRIVTDKGIVDLQLDASAAPQTVANFVKLVEAKYFDGILIHRMEPGFVVQAGDPLTRGLGGPELLAILARRDARKPKASDPAVGTGGPGWAIPLEPNDLLHDRGVIAMARSADPDSAGSQFYITLAPAHDLDGDYVVFGKVAKGMDVVDKLVVGDKILSATVVGN